MYWINKIYNGIIVLAILTTCLIVPTLLEKL